MYKKGTILCGEDPSFVMCHGRVVVSFFSILSNLRLEKGFTLLAEWIQSVVGS